ncbi:hypothetical protein GCM10012280_03550 [Wenjunlia tyrosinilytica]|uniref:Uncharacterized protein n=1 Tax=Wenjunlia tyrosinilytica TaxID=1544741 RepID=A0A917ZD00_9ACTN|nr:hypothetical protein GCM10012280_03550 [Wenjunlia tyrosinilytica]
MVGVEVGEHQQGDAGDGEFAQACVDRLGCGAGVDDHGGTGSRRQDQGISLADVAHRHTPVPGRPAGDEAGQRCGAQDRHHQEEDQDRAQRRSAQERPGDDHGEGAHPGEEQAAERASGPVELGAGKSCARAGDGGDPTRGPTCQSAQRFGDGHRHGGGCEGREAEHGGWGDGQFGEQIAGDGDKADAGGHDRDDGSAHGLGRRCGGDDFCEAAGHSAVPQALAPAWGDDQQSAGCQYGQQEAVGAGQPGEEQHEEENGSGEAGDEGATAPGANGHQGDEAAGGGAQDARLGAAEDDKADREQAPEERGQAQRQSEARGETAAFGADGEAGRTDEYGEQDRQVRSAHREEMAEIGRTEVLGELGRDTGGVSDDQARQEGPGIGRQPVGGRAKPGTEPPGSPLDGGGCPGDAWHPADPQDGGDAVPGQGGWGELGVGGHSRRRQQVHPLGGAGTLGENEDGGANPGGLGDSGDAVGGGLQHDQGGPLSRPPHMRAVGAGITADGELHGRPPMLPGKRRNGSPVEVGGMAGGDKGGGRRAEQHPSPRGPACPALAPHEEKDGEHQGADGDRQHDGRRSPERERGSEPRGGRRESQSKVGRTTLGVGSREPAGRGAGGRGAGGHGTTATPGIGGLGVGCVGASGVAARRTGTTHLPVVGHGCTRDRRSLKRRLPMPVTSRSWSTEVKPPCWVR